MRMIDADSLAKVLNDLWLATSPRENDDKETALERAAMCRGIDDCIMYVHNSPTVSGWVSVKDRMPDTHSINDHEADLMLYIPKREGVRQHGIYLGFLRKEPMPPDDGNGNFWGVPCPGSDWTVWGWSHFEEPIVTYWMPLPALPDDVKRDA